MSKTPPKRHRKDKTDGPVWLYGRHAVAAALREKKRHVHQLAATLNAAKWLTEQGLLKTDGWQPEDMKPEAIDRLLPAGAVHQGLAMRVNPLPPVSLEAACKGTSEDVRPVLVLDQITDPQNIGALFRSAAAFGARAIIVQDRRTPPLSGALAKAAAGAIETIPCVRVVNISRALAGLKDFGYHCAGLAGEAGTRLQDLPRNRPVALVMGAEGAGLRQLVAETCDELVRIEIKSEMESLNVSNAAAIALYELSR